MSRRALLSVLTLAIAGLVGVATPAAPQAELDRIVSRVNNRIITRSDVRQARLLQLVEHTGSDDDAQRDLENRVLILSDAARSAPLPPGATGDLAERRRAWETRVGGGARVGKLLADAGMTEAGLEAWLGDDLRADAHLRRLFGALPDADRARAIQDWIARLRQRAGLR